MRSSTLIRSVSLIEDHLPISPLFGRKAVLISRVLKTDNVELCCYFWDSGRSRSTWNPVQLAEQYLLLWFLSMGIPYQFSYAAASNRYDSPITRLTI